MQPGNGEEAGERHCAALRHVMLKKFTCPGKMAGLWNGMDQSHLFSKFCGDEPHLPAVLVFTTG